MNRVADYYDLAADLFRYPGAGYRAQAERCRAAFAAALPEAGNLVAAFAAAVGKMAPEEVEELFTRTFDLNPACAPEVGWHLFGENYSRGEFLVRMRQELRRHGLPESTELPDHLAHVLAVLARLTPDEADPFAERFVLPALDKMIAGLSGKDNPYEKLLEAVRRLTTVRHAPAAPEVSHG